MSRRGSSTDPGSGPSVLHLVRTDAFAGVERYLTYVAPELARRGVDVTVVGGEPGRMPASLDGTGVTWVPSRSWRRDLHAIGSVGPSLVHAHMTDAEALASLAKLRTGVRVVSTLHFAKPRGRNRTVNLLLSPLSRLLDAQVAISAFVAASAGEPGAVVVPNGVLNAPAGGERDRTVLVAQRLEAEKDTVTAVRAWAESGLADDGWRLVIAGDGAQRDAVRRLVDGLGLTRSVDLVGMVDDVQARMGRASIFLASAPREPFGLAVVEAMAAATPVVAAAGGAHLETLGGDGRAFAFPPGDPVVAGAVLRRLASEEPVRTAYGRALANRYQAHFTVPRHVDGLLDVYRDVVTSVEWPLGGASAR